MGQRAVDLEEKITIPAAQIAAVRTIHKMEKPIYISFDEWAPHGRGFMAVLATAQYLNSFIRHADVVKMANFTLMTSLLGRDREKGTFKTPLFYTFKLFSNNCLGASLDVFVDCETFNTDEFFKDIPYLDASAVYSKESDSLILNVVNRHRDKAIDAEIISCSGDFSSEASASEVNRDDIRAVFSYDKRQDYVPVVKELAVEGNKFTYSFPAHSFTQMTLKLK
jgi:alpha-N-arabinofuranosidase